MALADRDYLRADDADRRAAVREASTAARFAGWAAVILLAAGVWQAAAGRLALLAIGGAAGLVWLVLRAAGRPQSAWRRASA